MVVMRASTVATIFLFTFRTSYSQLQAGIGKMPIFAQ